MVSEPQGVDEFLALQDNAQRDVDDQTRPRLQAAGETGGFDFDGGSPKIVVDTV